MNLLDKNYTEYQDIESTDKTLINDFLNTFFPIWEKDILKFDELSKELKVNNIKKIRFWSYTGINNELEYSITTNDNLIKKYYVPKELLESFLIEKDLLK